eukprot:s181_g10.t1
MDVKPSASVTAAVPARGGLPERFRASRPFLREAKAGHRMYHGSPFVMVLSLVKLVNSRRTSCRATRDINGMSDLVERGYDGFLLDQYGVLHDGRELLPDVKECLDQLQRRNIPMAIVSNSPCESPKAALRLERIGLMNEYFQSLVTSGDQAKRYLEKLISEAAPVRLSCLFISHADHVERGTWSPEELRSMGLELVASVDDCDFVLANGVQVCYKGTLSEVQSDYESDASDWSVFGTVLQAAAKAQRPLIIVNPDCVVHRNNGVTVNCPGQFAKKYSALGGEHLYIFGKPNPEIFREASRHLELSGARRICHIGDSLCHDVSGAADAGFASALVSSGIHAPELQSMSLSDLCRRKGVPYPTFAMSSFRW